MTIVIRKGISGLVKSSLIGFNDLRSRMISAPAAERNKEPILGVLDRLLGPRREEKLKVLEIASGTGQHITHFAKAFPNFTWFPTEVDGRYLPSIAAYVEDAGLTNVQESVRLDITAPPEDFPEPVKGQEFDVLYNANMIHISPFETTVGLFNTAGKILKLGTGLLVMYGPFAENGLLEPESNVAFDEGLRAQNPQWGVRDIQDLMSIGAENGLKLLERVDMPANNKVLVWGRGGGSGGSGS